MYYIIEPKTREEKGYLPDSWIIANDILNQDFNNPKMKNRIIYLIDKKKYYFKMKEIDKILRTHTFLNIIGVKDIGGFYEMGVRLKEVLTCQL